MSSFFLCAWDYCPKSRDVSKGEDVKILLALGLNFARG